MTVVEVCVEDVEGVGVARQGGADRVELCAELWCGGLTPSFQTIEGAQQVAPPEGLRILVRENPTSFQLSEAEAQKQTEDIAAIRHSFGDSDVPLGFVVGGLRDGRLDRRWLDAWRQAAGGHTLIFHRAFDQIADRDEAMEILVDAGFDGVLTTGGSTGNADIPGLKALMTLADGRLAIIGSGGVRADNVAAVITQAGLEEVHFRAPAPDGPGTDAQTVTETVGAVRVVTV